MVNKKGPLQTNSTRMHMYANIIYIYVTVDIYIYTYIYIYTMTHVYMSYIYNIICTLVFYICLYV